MLPAEQFERWIDCAVLILGLIGVVICTALGNWPAAAWAATTCVTAARMIRRFGES
jgi:hypothetical protein